MMHVAEAGEAKGRVVLELCSGEANPVALDAAIWLALAFQSEIESLFVESEQLVQLANLPMAREISISGREKRAVSLQQIERHFRSARLVFQRQIEERARAADVPFKPRVVRDDPVHAIELACAETGPWNIVALAAPFTSPSFPSLQQLFDSVNGTTGLMLVGPATRRTSGPIVLAVEDVDLLPALVTAAERLAKIDDSDIVICLIGNDEESLADIEPTARLALAENKNNCVLCSETSRGSSEHVADRLRRLKPGLIIGQFGGDLVPNERSLRALAAWLECPLLLVRGAAKHTAENSEQIGN